MRVAIALLSNIEASQNEIIAAIFSQAMEFVENIVVIDFYANNKLNRVINSTPEILNMKQYTYDKWSEIYEHYVEDMKEFDKVIVFKTPLVCDVNLLNEMEEQIAKDDTYCMQYEKMRKIFERMLFVKAIRDKDVYQLVIDPREFNFSQYWDFKSYKRVCTWKSETDEYGPIYEYSLVNTFIQEIPKAQDIYFVGSVYDESKEYLYTEFKKEFDRRLGKRHKGGVFNNPIVGRFELFDKESKDKRVTQSTYLYNLMLSRYTLVVAPYMQERFNIMRFMEAVICGCIPLIVRYHNNLNDLILTYPDIYDIINKRSLVVNIDRVYVRIHDYEKDKKVLDEIRATKSFKRITNKEKVQQYFDKLLR